MSKANPVAGSIVAVPPVGGRLICIFIVDWEGMTNLGSYTETLNVISSFILRLLNKFQVVNFNLLYSNIIVATVSNSYIRAAEKNTKSGF